MRNIGKNIRDARLARGLTQQQLAEKLGLTHQALSGYETGRRRASLAQLHLLAEGLEVDIHQLLYGEVLPKAVRRSQLKRLLTGSLLYLLLFYGPAMGELFLADWMRRVYGHTFPILSLLRQITQPPALLLLGWTVMQGLYLLDILPPLTLPHPEALRRSTAVLLLAYWVFQILFWATAPHYPEWLAFPRKLLWTLRPPLGALLWLTEKRT